MKFIWIFVVVLCSVGTHAEPVKHTLKVNEHALALWEKRAAKPTRSILLIHGRTWSAIPDFDLQVPGEKHSLMDALVDRGYAVYALDLPGYGASPRDKSGWITPNMAAKDVESTLSWISANSGVPGKPVLFGWSMGSTLSQLVAQNHPELISDLILFGYWRNPDIEIEKDPVFIRVNSKSPTPEKKRNTAEGAAEDFVAPGAMSKEAIAAYVKAALKADPIKVDIRHMQEFAALDAARVKVPTLVLHAEYDLAKVDAIARLFSRLGHPDRQWVMIAGGDHAALIENTQPAFVAAMVAFMERPRRL